MPEIFKRNQAGWSTGARRLTDQDRENFLNSSDERIWVDLERICYAARQRHPVKAFLASVAVVWMRTIDRAMREGAE